MCTLCDKTLFKYLIMNGRALAQEHLTYAPLHDRMLHIEITTTLPLAFPAESASFNLGELAGRSREHWPTSLSALGILATTHRRLRCVWVCFPRICRWSSFSISLSVVSPRTTYISIYSPISVYIRMHTLYIYIYIGRTVYMHLCQCDRLHGGTNRTATSRKLHPPSGETASIPETIPRECFRGDPGLIETAAHCASWMLTSALLS